MKRKAAAVAAAVGLLGAVAVPGTGAHPNPTKWHKCNAGAGNGSELVPLNEFHFVDCDPGGSGLVNRAGD